MISCCIPYTPKNSFKAWLWRYEWGRRLWRLKTRIEQWKHQVEAEVEGEFLLFGNPYVIRFTSLRTFGVMNKNRDVFPSHDIRQIMAGSYIKHEDNKL